MSNSEIFCGPLSSFTWSNHLLECKSENGSLLRVYVLTDDIIRIRYASDGYLLEDFSYAIDPAFVGGCDGVSFEEGPDIISIKTQSVQCRIHKADLKITFLDHHDQVISKDEKGFHYEKDLETGNDIVQMSKLSYPSEVYFGLGDKPSDLNLKGRRFENWGTDSYGYDYNRDPLYKNIPFYYGLHNGVGYGIFFDNSFRTYFDFGKERDVATSFWAQGGEMNYYFIAGPELLEVNKRYAALTGKAEMPALWALGYQQCKWSYYPESQVREVTTKMREHKIPCDSIYLDIDYMDGFRCFTWDNERFPAPKQMIDDLREQGFKTMVIIDPGIKIDHDYDVFKEGLEKGYFCRRLDGPYAEGKVWPGDCYFPDFTNPEVREWWADLYKGLIADLGVAGVWNDMNEPALFEVDSKTMTDDVMFHYDGHPSSHRKAHNVYGMQMARATYEGVKRHGDNKRGLIITRSGYAGLQRYSSVWTGDNISTWQHVWLANVQCQRLAISGVSFAGSDIGGFIGQPTPEMFIRWIQLAIFHPFCRVHSSQDDGDQEPWSFGPEALDLFREAVELRYRMLPYHYTAFYDHYISGSPILKPISFVDQHDPETYNRDHEFVCGDHILTASIDKELMDTKEVYLTKGAWYNYWNDELIRGGQPHMFKLTKSTFPLYIKAGAIIPLYPVQQFVGEIEIKEVELHVYYKEGEEVSSLYEDAHDGYEYQEKDHRLSVFRLNGSQASLEISQQVEGDFSPSYEHYKLHLHGFPSGNDVHIEVDGATVESLQVPLNFGRVMLSW